ncbi:killer cell lectin-like receptor subfamily B member 1B allele B isoform X1 [Eubalaena glacialis]|uniref:killer cell lectin-like receptor subfamily B member 1B allele B isoform X1 n=1 Tax=Eubalaena glacialis TaxID=27606 RepID=UPI002A59E7B1|nr:killer cell lectin-like receptor subfamily B member 1B allele B isoform X1 [Eubalaena glacialis]
MAGDIVYADIKHSSSGHSSSRQRSDSHHHGIFLKVGCAMIIILLVIVIVLSIFVIQFKSARHTEVSNESKEKYCTGQNKSETSTSVVSFNSSTARKSCPSEDWKLHGGKCYWVAESEKSWHESKKDCVMKNSHLLVIRDIIDMVSKERK